MKLAVIGAAMGQLPLCRKAREMGLETICFAWEKGAVCKDEVDRFYPVSVLEKEKIADICRQEQVCGVVTNASDLLSEVAAFVSEELGLHGNSFSAVRNILDKEYVRSHTEGIEGLGQVRNMIYDGNDPGIYPCVVKPDSGSSKKGVSFVADRQGLEEAVSYASSVDSRILVEEYIEGREISVESISYEGSHQIIQVTDKDTSGYPHFVELGHHQPSSISSELRRKLESIVPEILGRLSFMNGASHLEFRISPAEEIFLIEVNPRGGGDHISDTLVQLSTGFDYLRAMIEVAAGGFSPSRIGHRAYAGIYYLCSQNEAVLPLFGCGDDAPWLVEKVVDDAILKEATGNYDRNGHLIYSYNHKIQADSMEAGNETEGRNLMVTVQCLVYNHAPYLRQCLDGFVMQKTDFPFEVIVHDDASTDESASIIREYAGNYPDIIKPIIEVENQYSKHDGSLGRIMDEATHGRYLAFCEGDDYWSDPLKLQKQVDLMESNPDCSLVYTLAKKWDEASASFDSQILGGARCSFSDLLYTNTISTLTALVRTSSYMDYRKWLDPEVSSGWLMTDYPIWLWISANHKISFLPECTAVYRVRKESASHSEDKDKTMAFLFNAYDISYYFASIYLDDREMWRDYINLNFAYLYRYIKLNHMDRYSGDMLRRFSSHFKDLNSKNKNRFIRKKIASLF